MLPASLRASDRPPLHRSTIDSSAAANEKLLDAAEKLFYERGCQSVGMLDRRDHQWHTELAEYVERRAGPAAGDTMWKRYEKVDDTHLDAQE